jgi:hypothetical protein
VRKGKDMKNNIYLKLCPSKKVGSCLDPELPGTGLREGADAGPGPPCSGERVSWNPAEMGETTRDRGGTHSGCDAGGSAANRVRRLSVHCMSS